GRVSDRSRAAPGSPTRGPRSGDPAGQRLAEAGAVKAGYLWLASFAVSPAVAWPLLAHSAYRRLSLACRVGIAAAAGTVLLSTWMTLFTLAGIAWRPAPLIAGSILTAFLLRLLVAAAPPLELEAGPAGVWTPRLSTAVVVAAIFIALAATAAAAATSPDLLIFWGPKAQAFAAARGIDANFLRDPALDYMHASYPPLVTNLYAFASIVAGRFPWGPATLTLPPCLAALAPSPPPALPPPSPPPP